MRGRHSLNFISCSRKKYISPRSLRFFRKDSNAAKLSCIGFTIIAIGFAIFTTTVNATTHDFQSIQRHSDGTISPVLPGKPWRKTPIDSLNSGNTFNALGSLSVAGDHILESRGHYLTAILRSLLKGSVAILKLLTI